tara:strand:+ start:5915 stop:7060 length:1146 start_codon:yes stop_codon:yes gene_type:complete
MAQRGRPRKKAKVEEANVEQVESVVTEEETTTEPVAEEPSSQPEPFTMDGTLGDFNPFAQNVVEREYATPKVAQGIVEDLEEPTFEQKNPFDERREQENQPPPHPFEEGNPALHDMDFQDKKIACESLVDTCLDTYEQLHSIAQNFVQVDEAELMQKQMDGEIDLAMDIPVDEQGTTMSVMDFVQQYNEQSKEALQYDKEFGYKVRPAMLRVFMKKGWGMTDEQFLMYAFGKDLLTKTAIVFSLKKTMNNTFDLLKKNFEGGNIESETSQSQSEAETYEQEDVYEEPIPSNEPEVEFVQKVEPIIVQNDVPKKDEVAFSQKMNINMPQKQRGDLSEHPKEVRDIIRDGIKEEQKAKAKADAKKAKKSKKNEDNDKGEDTPK